MFFLRELNVICEGRIDNAFEDLPHTFYDILAVFACVDDPADRLLKLISCSFWFIKAALTVNVEHFLDDSKDLEEKATFREVAGSTDWTFDAVEENKGRVVDFKFWDFIIFEMLEQCFRQSLFLTFNVRSQIPFKWVRDRTCKFRQGLKIILIFLFSLD